MRTNAGQKMSAFGYSTDIGGHSKEGMYLRPRLAASAANIGRSRTAGGRLAVHAARAVAMPPGAGEKAHSGGLLHFRRKMLAVPRLNQIFPNAAFHDVGYAVKPDLQDFIRHI